MKRKILIILLIIMFLVTGCNKKKEKLILATEAGFAPYEYYSNGEIVGVDIDIAKKIAEELGMELVIKDVAFDSIISEVKTDKSDNSISVININLYPCCSQANFFVITISSLHNSKGLTSRIKLDLLM